MPFRELIATPLGYRGVFLGYLALLDKEERGGGEGGFSPEDRRFLESVAALAGVALDGARQIERLETQSERLAEENKVLRGQLASELEGSGIVAASPGMRRVLELVERVAPRSVNVLVRGESGTGKELVAKLLHHLSGRSGSLVAINCGALPESLLESELFGIEGGVATGVSARRGKFELAGRRDALPRRDRRHAAGAAGQAPARAAGARDRPPGRRAADPGRRPPGGGDPPQSRGAGRRGSFREDLYYRIKGVELELPPLRQRREEIPLLVRHFVEQFCGREGIPVPPITRDALALLLDYDYPGNVRELENLIAGAVSLADGVDRGGARALSSRQREPGLRPRSARSRGGRAAAHRTRAQARQRQPERGREAPRGGPPHPASQGFLTSQPVTSCFSSLLRQAGQKDHKGQIVSFADPL